MRFHCLILDHDDTAVDSTREIHYPAHLEVMRRLRPDQEPISLEGWYRKNFDPGIMGYLVDELGMSPEELEEEFTIWRNYTSTRVPHFYPGFLELLRDFRAEGGRIAVVSHSERELIERDYRTRSPKGAAAPSGGYSRQGSDAPDRREGSGSQALVPDLIFGWDHDESRRKPSPWPVEQILEGFGVKTTDALIVDDLKPAVLMARASGVEVAAAGWGHDIPEIHDYMRRNCIAFLSSVAELRSFVMG